jgi:hypothetical protein
MLRPQHYEDPTTLNNAICYSSPIINNRTMEQIWLI